jgi:hypothetical protein
MSDLISQIQIDEIQAEPTFANWGDEPTFANWAEYKTWLDSLPDEEPLYFPGDE